MLTFGIMSALERQPAALASLCARVSESQTGNAGKEIAEIMATGDRAGDRLEDHIAMEIYKIVHRGDLTPNELFVAGLRFFQSTKSSNFKKLLAPALAGWARERWTYAIEEQQFYLRNPSGSVPPIREALASPDSGLAFVGKLFVAIEPALKPQFDQSFPEFLLSL